MLHYDASTAECLVYTHKTGWLPRLAHDLKHRVTRFALAIDERTSAIHAAVDARSLRVVCAMQGGMETPSCARARATPLGVSRGGLDPRFSHWTVPDELAARRHAARQQRVASNRSTACTACPRAAPVTDSGIAA